MRKQAPRLDVQQMNGATAALGGLGCSAGTAHKATAPGARPPLILFPKHPPAVSGQDSGLFFGWAVLVHA